VHGQALAGLEAAVEERQILPPPQNIQAGLAEKALLLFVTPTLLARRQQQPEAQLLL
jgi:hypothetical protein